MNHPNPSNGEGYYVAPYQNAGPTLYRTSPDGSVATLATRTELDALDPVLWPVLVGVLTRDPHTVERLARAAVAKAQAEPMAHELGRQIWHDQIWYDLAYSMLAALRPGECDECGRILPVDEYAAGYTTCERCVRVGAQTAATPDQVEAAAPELSVWAVRTPDIAHSKHANGYRAPEVVAELECNDPTLPSEGPRCGDPDCCSPTSQDDVAPTDPDVADVPVDELEGEDDDSPTSAPPRIDADTVVALVLEAIDLPGPATAGDTAAYYDLLQRRVVHLVQTLPRLTTREAARYPTQEHALGQAQWHMDYLRARLAELPIAYGHKPTPDVAGVDE